MRFHVGDGNVEERDGGGFHGDAALLFVVARVEVAHLADEARVDDAIGGDEVIGEGGLAVVDVREDADVAHTVLHGACL